jgi:hypothetical protein
VGALKRLWGPLERLWYPREGVGAPERLWGPQRGCGGPREGVGATERPWGSRDAVGAPERPLGGPTLRKERLRLRSMLVISRLPMTISQPVYISLMSLYCMSELPVMLRAFLVPEQTVTRGRRKCVIYITDPRRINIKIAHHY